MEIIIPRWSNDRWKYKKAAIRSYLCRALTHCSTENFLTIEIEKITEIAKRHGYSKSLVNKTLREIKLKRGNVIINQHVDNNSLTHEEFEVVEDV